ncbi:MAG TPA: sigma-70 family RNA polymerase sigma factor [Longimicrobium sp.]|jgi:RNA polymerase sigma factor for flagellar operon FliA
MLDRADAEAIFLKHLEWINRAASKACSKYGVHGPDADDFTARVRMKLVEDDYVVIRRFVGNSEIKTYLLAVVRHLLADLVREQRGRWRVSAAAERLGPPAPELERLVYHDRYTVPQAGEKLRTAGRTALSDTALARMLAELPERTPMRPEVQEPEKGVDPPGDSRADERVMEAEAGTRRAEMLAVLETVIGELDEEDRLIVQMHFARGETVATVARALRLEQKPLYRRVERLRSRLRGLLESAGLRPEDVRGLLHEHDAP